MKLTEVCQQNATKIVGYEWAGSKHRALEDTKALRAVWKFLQYKE